MGRKLFMVEKGLRLVNENKDPLQDESVSVLFGSAAPGGDAGDQDASFIGSLYLRTDGTIYRKIANIAATSDWQIILEELDIFKQETGVTTPTVLDSVLVDNILASEWEVHMREDATPANVKVVKVFAAHDGTASADAVNVDDTAYAKLKVGANFDAELTVELNGAAGAQVMRLSVESASAGVTFTSRRTDIKYP